jgi:kynurenine formamidase
VSQHAEHVVRILVDERLARACAEEGRYEFLFTATPIRLVGSTGAPAHPLAIF